MTRCTWWRKHVWGAAWSTSFLTMQGRATYCLETDLLYDNSQRDAVAALLAGEPVQACTRCGRVRRAEPAP